MNLQPFTAIYIVILIALIALLVVLVFQYINQRFALSPKWFSQFWTDTNWDDEAATEIALAPMIEAYLLAETPKPGLPLQIHLSTDSDVVLGRDRGLCNVILRDIGISRRHASINYVNHKFQIQDLGSKGGTFLDRRRLRPKQPYSLTPDVLVQFYDVSYRFILADGETEKHDERGTIGTET